MTSGQVAALAAILRGDPSALEPAVVCRTVDDQLVDAAIEHGVAILIRRELKERALFHSLEPGVAARLDRIARETALIDAVRRQALSSVVESLCAAGVRPLIFKGDALALTVYPSPELRPRGDADLLVRREDVGATCAHLERLGFTRVPRPIGTQVTQQARYAKQEGPVELACDVHWRVVDPHAFADAFPFDELDRDGVADLPFPARRPGANHALLIACAHRAAHHHDTERLILLYDIHLLGKSLGTGWDRFIGLATAKRLRAVCLRGLSLARNRLGTPVPDFVLAELAIRAQPEPTAMYVGGSMRRVDILRSDLRQLPTWRAKLQLLTGHLFPGEEYMRTSGRAGPSEPLAVAYVRRVFAGIWRWFKPLR